MNYHVYCYFTAQSGATHLICNFQSLPSLLKQQNHSFLNHPLGSPSLLLLASSSYNLPSQTIAGSDFPSSLLAVSKPPPLNSDFPLFLHPERPSSSLNYMYSSNALSLCATNSSISPQPYSQPTSRPFSQLPASEHISIPLFNQLQTFYLL